MPNTHVQPARERQWWNDERCATRACLQRGVRQRVLENAAAPAIFVTNHTSESGARQLTVMNRRPHQRGGIHQLRGWRTRCLAT